MPKKKTKLKELTKPDVTFISLVNRPANQTPIRVTKSDDNEDDNMTVKMVKRGDSPSEMAPEIAALVIRKENKDLLLPEIEKLGFPVEYQVEVDDAVFVSQKESFDEKNATAIQVSEDVAVLVEGISNITKAFDPYMAPSAKFQENVAVGGFMPGIFSATDALIDTMHGALMNSDDVEAAKKTFKKALKDYSNHVLGLVDTLPSMVFKLESINMINLSKKMTDADLDKDESITEETEVAEKGEGKCPEGQSYDQESGKCKEDEKESAQKADEEVTDKVDEAIAEMTEKQESEDEPKSEPAQAEKAETETEEAETETTEKTEDKAEDAPAWAADLVATVKSLNEKVNTLEGQLVEQKAKTEDAQQEAEEAKKQAEQAEEKLNTTVVTTVIPNEGLGTMSRVGGPQVLKGEQTKKSENPDDMWEGVMDGLFT